MQSGCRAIRSDGRSADCNMNTSRQQRHQGTSSKNIADKRSVKSSDTTSRPAGRTDNSAPCNADHRLLHLQDYRRIDLRLRPDGKLVILEANPNPAFAYGEEVAESAEKAGVTCEQLIDRIIQAALRRCE